MSDPTDSTNISATLQSDQLPTDPGIEQENQPAPISATRNLRPANETMDQTAIIVVLIQTGASRSGAEALFQQMTDQEKQLFSESIAVEQGSYIIRDSAKYFEAFQSINDRLYKASAEGSGPPA